MTEEIPITEWKKTLEEAKINNTFIRLLFQYPSSNRILKKSGHVKHVYEDSFDFDEIYDGHSTYSYRYLIGISRGEANGTV